MPNGRPGDHPYTDVVMHKRRVYSERADDLIRQIHAIATEPQREVLAARLASEYDNFNNPDIAALERFLEQEYARIRGENP